MLDSCKVYRQVVPMPSSSINSILFRVRLDIISAHCKISKLQSAALLLAVR